MQRKWRREELNQRRGRDKGRRRRHAVYVAVAWNVQRKATCTSCSCCCLTPRYVLYPPMYLFPPPPQDEEDNYILSWTVNFSNFTLHSLHVSTQSLTSAYTLIITLHCAKVVAQSASNPFSWWYRHCRWSCCLSCRRQTILHQIRPHEFCKCCAVHNKQWQGLAKISHRSHFASLAIAVCLSICRRHSRQHSELVIEPSLLCG